MTAIEDMALILALIAAIKLIVVSIKPKLWIDYVAKKFWSSEIRVTLIGLIFAPLSLYYLLQELTIVQIFAVMFFLMFIMMIGLAPIYKDMLKIVEKKYGKRLPRDAWLSILIWALLVIWVLISIL